MDCGEKQEVERLKPVFAVLAVGIDAALRTPGREKKRGTAEQAIPTAAPAVQVISLKCCITHRIRADGRLCRRSQHPVPCQLRQKRSEADAETPPLRDPEFDRDDFNLTDITEVWRLGSVVASWILDLSAFKGGRVSDSGEGLLTAIAAIDEGIPAHVLNAALNEWFSSRDEMDFVCRHVYDALRARRAQGEGSGPEKELDDEQSCPGCVRIPRCYLRSAYKQVFTALQALIGRGHPDAPIIGVAQSGWRIEQLRARPGEP